MSDVERMVEFDMREKPVTKDGEMTRNKVATGVIGRLLHEANYQDRHIDELLYGANFMNPPVAHPGMPSINSSHHSMSLQSMNYERLQQPMMPVPNLSGESRLDTPMGQYQDPSGGPSGSYRIMPGCHEYDMGTQYNHSQFIQQPPMPSMLPLPASSENLFGSRNVSFLSEEGDMTQSPGSISGQYFSSARISATSLGQQHMTTLRNPSFTALYPAHTHSMFPSARSTHNLLSPHHRQSSASIDDKMNHPVMQPASSGQDLQWTNRSMGRKSMHMANPWMDLPEGHIGISSLDIPSDLSPQAGGVTWLDGEYISNAPFVPSNENSDRSIGDHGDGRSSRPSSALMMNSALSSNVSSKHGGSSNNLACRDSGQSNILQCNTSQENLKSSPRGKTPKASPKNRQRLRPGGAVDSDRGKGSDKNEKWMTESALLTKIRSGRLKDVPLSDLLPNINEFAVDQFGSRHIQNILDVCGRRDLEHYVNMIVSKIDVEMVSEDIFGNYVIQKLIEKATPAQRLALTSLLENSILTHCMKICGCRVIQALINFGDESVHEVIVTQIQGHIYELIEDQNGNHVIQKSLSKMNGKNVTRICNLIRGSAYAYAVHGYGCRVMQRILENANNQFVAEICDEMLPHGEELITHKYGNYVLQHIARYGDKRHHQVVYDLILNRFARCAMHKYASNVVEKCLKFGVENFGMDLIGIVDLVMTKKGTVHELLIEDLAYDRYANYVVQRLFECVSQNQKLRMYNGLKTQMALLKNSSFGKHLGQALVESFGEKDEEEEARE